MTNDPGLTPKQQARIDKAQRKAARPWPLRHKFLTGFGALVVLIIVIAIATSGGGSKNNPAPVTGDSPAASPQASSQATGPLSHASDYQIVSCAKDNLGNLDAKVKITNTSTKPSNYTGTIAFDSPDGKTQYDTGPAFAQDVQPGQSTTVDATTLTPAPGPYICKLVDATRMSAVG